MDRLGQRWCADRVMNWLHDDPKTTHAITKGKSHALTLKIAYGNVLVDLHTNLGRIIRQCRDYFGPNDDFGKRERTMWRMECEQDNMLQFHVTPRGSVQQICLENEQDGYRWSVPKWQVLEVPCSRSLILVATKWRRLRIVSRTQDALFYHTRKVIRHVITSELVQAGAVMFHAACLERAGVGIAIAGARNTGKTTTLCALLRSAGSAYVSNDKLLITSDSDSVHGIGWPTKVGVCIGTRLAVPELRPFVPSGSLCLDRMNPDNLWNNPKSRLFLPGDFARAFCAQRRRSTVIKYVVFPELHSSGSRPCLRPLNSRDFTARLQASVLGLHHSDDHFRYPVWLGLSSVSQANLIKSSAACIDRIVRSTTGFSLRGGGDVEAIQEAAKVLVA
jgi:hypothetical protein